MPDDRDQLFEKALARQLRADGAAESLCLDPETLAAYHERALSPEEMAGVAYFREENCIACHVIGEKGTKVGPDLTANSIHRDAKWMIQHFKRPAAVRPGSSMPPTTR